MGKITLSVPFGNTDMTIETGRLAKLTAGAVLVTMGETVVLVTAAGGSSPRTGFDFLPLTCEYIEKQYAGGKIPGGYFKRETRPGPAEVLNARVIDRPMRPFFPKTWRKEIQLIATVLSFDHENDPAICALVGASCATTISDIPFDGPNGGCRVALVDGEYLINPTFEQTASAKLSLVVAATEDAVTMVEGEGEEASEEEMIDAIIAAHEAIKPIIQLQKDLRKKVGKEKQEVVEVKTDADLYMQVVEASIDDLADALSIPQKTERKAAVSAACKSVKAALIAEDASLEDRTGEIQGYLERVQRDIVRI
jgi:polyribonucleotide nucleotidyltransferase